MRNFTILLAFSALFTSAIASTSAGTLKCPLGYVETSVHGGDTHTCSQCHHGSRTCTTTNFSPTNITPLTCLAGYNFINNHCSNCPTAFGSAIGNTDPKCYPCRDPISTVTCSTGTVIADLNCQSNFFLYKSLCMICPISTGTTFSNSNPACERCSKSVPGIRSCNLNIHPGNITSCLTGYNYSVVKKMGVCTLGKKLK